MNYKIFSLSVLPVAVAHNIFASSFRSNTQRRMTSFQQPSESSSERSRFGRSQKQRAFPGALHSSKSLDSKTVYSEACVSVVSTSPSLSFMKAAVSLEARAAMGCLIGIDKVFDKASETYTPSSPLPSEGKHYFDGQAFHIPLN